MKEGRKEGAAVIVFMHHRGCCQGMTLSSGQLETGCLATLGLVVFGFPHNYETNHPFLTLSITASILNSHSP